MKKTFQEFLVGLDLTKEKFDSLSAEEKAGHYNDYNTELKSYIETLEKNVDGKATKEDVEKAISEFKDSQIEQMKSLNEAMKEMGLAIKANSESEKSVFHSDVRKALLDNKSNIEELKTSKNGGFSTIIKAAGTMLESTNISGGNVPVEQRIAGLNTVASRTPRFLDYLSRKAASSNIISWVYQANKDGAAGGTDEGAAKNQIDFDLVVASQAVVKRTAYIKVSTEMLDDIDFIESEIRAELMRELLKDVEDTAYDGNGTAPNLNGVYTVATTFAAGTFANAVDEANDVDVLVVAANQIAIAEQDMPNAIFMHPSDVTALKLVKVTASDRRYVDRLVMVAGQLSLDGTPIVPTTLVTQGEFLMGDFSKASLYDKGELRIEIGLDADDWTKNLRTILAEWRGALVVKNNDRTAFVKGVFATAKAALETT